MNAFEQAWESSRHNAWSWGYPTTLALAVAVVIALSFVRRSVLRRTLKVIAILSFSFIATDFSDREIREKWRLRSQWADTHTDQMREADWDALTVDGANLQLGPIIYGLQATVVLVGIAFVCFLVRMGLFQLRTSKQIRDASDVKVGEPYPMSCNPYHPPHSST
jgi:hypothetical protein